MSVGERKSTGRCRRYRVKKARRHCASRVPRQQKRCVRHTHRYTCRCAAARANEQSTVLTGKTTGTASNSLTAYSKNYHFWQFFLLSRRASPPPIAFHGAPQAPKTATFCDFWRFSTKTASHARILHPQSTFTKPYSSLRFGASLLPQRPTKKKSFSSSC